MVLDISLLNTQHYKVCIKGKLELSKESTTVASDETDLIVFYNKLSSLVYNISK